jgi:DNA polymerase III delta subunit
MIYLIHGNDIVSSRERLIGLKKSFIGGTINSLVAKEIDYKQFPILFMTDSLFGEKQYVVVEGKLDHSAFDWKSVTGNDVDLVIWVGEKLRANDGLIKTVNENKGKVEVFEEKIDSNIFPFLDAVVSKKRKNTFMEFQRLLDSGSDPIYIHTMLVWQFRMLLAPELASGFVRKKVDAVLSNFEYEELRKIYYMLLLIEVQLKTGEGIPEAILEQFLYKITR